MVTGEQIESWCSEVVRRFRPSSIVLFGSYANGTAGADSDVDFLVVIRGATGRRRVNKAAAIRYSVRAAFPLDVIVRSPEDVARKVAQGDGFLTSIMRNGRILYEAEHA